MDHPNNQEPEPDAMNAEQFLESAARLAEALDELGMLEDGEFEQLLVRQCALYGNDDDDNRVGPLNALYVVLTEITEPEQRREALGTLTGLVESGETTVDSLLPFMYVEDDTSIIRQTALTLALFFEPEDGDPLTGPKFVRTLVDEARDDLQLAALLDALLLLGDRRVVPLLTGSWRKLGFRGQQRLAEGWSGFAFASTIDFYLAWLNDCKGAEMRLAATALARMPREASPDYVVDLERVFPASAAPEAPAKVLRQWTFPEYATVIEPILRQLAEREQRETTSDMVMPLVLEAWGL
jgi:hypothetical protein